MSSEENAYVLGTDLEERQRLGYQHQVWSTEARKSWQIAEVGPGQTILDLGCGPGFCSTELAYITGPTGRVVAVDKSSAFITYLDALSGQYGLNIESICSDFRSLMLPKDSFDVIFCRWALAWVEDPETLIDKLYDFLKPGGVLITQEYYDWMTLQSSPALPALQKAFKAAFNRLEDQAGDINIGKRMSKLCYESGLEVISTRQLSKLAQPDDLNWHWPKSFLHVFLPKLVALDLITQEEMDAAMDDFNTLEFMPHATILCPQMIEVIAVKP